MSEREHINAAAHSHAHVTELLPAFGFVQTDDGRTLRFDRDDCVHPHFEHLRVGDRVVIIEESGCARRVAIDPHHLD